MNEGRDNCFCVAHGMEVEGQVKRTALSDNVCYYTMCSGYICTFWVNHVYEKCTYYE